MEKYYKCFSSSCDQQETDNWLEVVQNGESFYPLSTIFNKLVRFFEKNYGSHTEARANIFISLMNASKKLDNSNENFIMFNMPKSNSIIKLSKI